MPLKSLRITRLYNAFGLEFIQKTDNGRVILYFVYNESGITLEASMPRFLHGHEGLKGKIEKEIISLFSDYNEVEKKFNLYLKEAESEDFNTYKIHVRHHGIDYLSFEVLENKEKKYSMRINYKKVNGLGDQIAVRFVHVNGVQLEYYYDSDNEKSKTMNNIKEKICKLNPIRIKHLLNNPIASQNS